MEIPENIYLRLTKEFNEGKTRAIISSGQAVVLHRLAMTSKDGDWIIRENIEDCHHILEVLQRWDARYRFGAPLDPRWLVGGWSSHFEFSWSGTRVRCDFVSRPPRLTDVELDNIWISQDGGKIPFLPVAPLVKIKQTQREKDYPIIGELARKLPPPEQLLFGRSARDLIDLARNYPDALDQVFDERPLLVHAKDANREALEEALDRERRLAMRKDEMRLDAYAQASGKWREAWPLLAASLQRLPLAQAHKLVLKSAESALPFKP